MSSFDIEVLEDFAAGGEARPEAPSGSLRWTSPLSLCKHTETGGPTRVRRHLLSSQPREFAVCRLTQTTDSAELASSECLDPDPTGRKKYNR